MIRWALIMVSAGAPNSQANVTLQHIYDSPDDCSSQAPHIHFFGGAGYQTCIEIDGNKSPNPQVRVWAKQHKTTVPAFLFKKR
jgi:hypothetical protein